MEASKFSRFRRPTRKLRQAGFSMIETLIATVILTVGMVSLAALMSRTDSATRDSRYVSTAAFLCSEKLEQLSALAPTSVEIKIPAGNSAGSLTSDAHQNIGTKQVSYYDEVRISSANGSIRETTVDSAGKFTTIQQMPDGTLTQETKGTAPPPDSDTVVFKRRWLIEHNVAGFPPEVRRVTVRVDYPSGNRTANYQMTMVRNAEQ